MTTEQLLKKRFKVIADYPKSNYAVGEILTKGDAGMVFTMPHEKDICGNVREPIESIEKYPHLFKELQWWEDRKPEDMPEYVKEGEYIFKAKWLIKKGELKMKIFEYPDDELQWAEYYVVNSVMSFFSIATESEYLNYINSK